MGYGALSFEFLSRELTLRMASHFSHLIAVFLMRNYYILIWHYDLMQSSAKYCKVLQSSCKPRAVKSSLIHCRGAAGLKGRSH